MSIPFTNLDLIALALFFIGWIGYNAVFDWLPHLRPQSVNRHMFDVRSAWMTRMLQRENRMVDSQLLGHLISSVSFFASTTVLLMAGLLGLLAAAEEAHRVVGELGFSAQAPKVVFELKVLLLIAILVYGFFKFTWSLRQFNYTVALVGAAPLPPVPPELATELGEDLAALMSLAVLNFNAGLRAYYFAFAALGWVVDPVLFMAATIGVMMVLARRQTGSAALRRVSRYARKVGATPPQ